jgi:hypothetical protein
VQAQLQQLQAALDELDRSIAPGGAETLPPLQQAQVHLAHLDMAVSLTSCMHGLEGEGALPAALEPETRIVEAYRGKMTRALARVELATHRRPMEINIDAAHRFIEHATGLGQETREKLRKVRMLALCSCLRSGARYWSVNIDASSHSTCPDMCHCQHAVMGGIEINNVTCNGITLPELPGFGLCHMDISFSVQSL